MRIEPEIGGVSIVLLGNFNPAIFSPQWFARRDIVSEAEADEAQIEIIHPEVVMFTVGSKSVHIEQNRFQVESSVAPWVSIVDLIAKTFGEYLVYTPLTAFGINRQVHFRVRSEAIRHKLGRTLAPIEPWGEWGQEIENKSKELRSGLTELNMREAWKDEYFNGHTQTVLQPSVVLSGNSGIYMRVNNHNALNLVDEGEGAERVISALCEKFDSAISRSEWIIDQIMKLAEEIK